MNTTAEILLKRTYMLFKRETMLFATLILGEEDKSVYVDIDCDQKFKQYA